jgi:3-carboxy-cis,cis-muconate cycloisomerase
VVRRQSGFSASKKMAEIFSERHAVQCMLDFEAALARALVAAGIAPGTAAAAIKSKCQVDLYKIDQLVEASAEAGNLAIPLVKALTHQVAQKNKRAAGFVHWGATSQDAIDTGLVLQLREALNVLSLGLDRLADALTSLLQEHRSTVLPGRTWLQQAPPVTLGLKAAGWLDAVGRHRRRLRLAHEAVTVLQFGGAVGTLAALGDRGLAVASALSADLKLALPDIPWHAHRDRIAEVAATLGLLAGSLGKIARDISLMSQTEVAEVAEPYAPGLGGSSTMPHKRNPVDCAAVLAATIRVPALVSTMLSTMVQEHERGLGGWQAERETLPQIFSLTADALDRIIHLILGLEVNPRSMARNLEVTRGLIFSEAIAFALARHVGKKAAHELVERACRRSVAEDIHLRDILVEEVEVRAHLTPKELDRLFAPEKYLGSAGKMIDRVLKRNGIQRVLKGR